jgi:hypothetical protein
MARPRSDPFDVRAVRLAIERGETSERAAYLQYASKAARPYARSTFAALLKRAEAEPEPEPETTCADILDPRIKSGDWRERVAVKPRILSLSPGGRVQAGALVAFDGERKLIYTKAAKPPSAIVLSSVGGYCSIEAIRFCARANVAIVALDRAHGFLSVMAGAPKANAALIRAQAKADPMPIAA